MKVFSWFLTTLVMAFMSVLFLAVVFPQRAYSWGISTASCLVRPWGSCAAVSRDVAEAALPGYNNPNIPQATPSTRVVAFAWQHRRWMLSQDFVFGAIEGITGKNSIQTVRLTNLSARVDLNWVVASELQSPELRSPIFKYSFPIKGVLRWSRDGGEATRNGMSLAR